VIPAFLSKTFWDCPVLLKILGIFALVLILTRCKLNLGVSLILGAVAVALWFGHSLADTLLLTAQGILTPNALFLYLVVFLIVVLSSLLESSGMMRRLLTIVRSLVVSRRAVLALLPALIGFLPMPGGAAFSAPIVNAADDAEQLSPDQKTAINYWFRHVWEYWWPLYPGALLTWELSGLTFVQFASIQIPLTVLSLALGAVFLLLPLRLGVRAAIRPTIPFLDMLITATAIALPMVSFVVGLTIEQRTGLVVGKFLPMIPGLLASLLWVQWFAPSGKEFWLCSIANRRIWLLILTVVGVMAFSSALRLPVRLSGESGLLAVREIPALDLLHQDLKTWRIPPILVMMIIPFLAGLVTGLAYGFVGTSLPIVMTLAGENPTVAHTMSCVVMGYAFGYIGMMLSPIHICLLVSKEYFNASLSMVYKKIIMPAVGILLGSVLLSRLAEWIG